MAVPFGAAARSGILCLVGPTVGELFLGSTTPADAVRGAARPVDEGKAVGMDLLFLICLTARGAPMSAIPPKADIADPISGYQTYSRCRTMFS